MSTDDAEDFPEPVDAAEDEEVTETEEAPQDGASERAAMVDVIKDTWEQVDETAEVWRNTRDFTVNGGAVPQGVVRSLAEAYVLEASKIG